MFAAFVNSIYGVAYSLTLLRTSKRVWRLFQYHLDLNVRANFGFYKVNGHPDMSVGTCFSSQVGVILVQ